MRVSSCCAGWSQGTASGNGKAVTVGPVGEQWDPAARGVVRLPSGRLVRGRALRRPLPPGPEPEHGLYLLGRLPEPTPWPQRWVRWPDLRLPADSDELRQALGELLERTAHERVEIGCGGGRGRTGTAIACLAVLDGLPAAKAVAWVREHYDRRAVETPWQKRYVRAFPSGPGRSGPAENP